MSIRWPTSRHPAAKGPICSLIREGVGLGDGIGYQHAAQTQNFVFENQLSFFQTLDLNLIERSSIDDLLDYVVQIPMLTIKLSAALIYGLLIFHLSQSFTQSRLYLTESLWLG
jgi:hypothetical protein